MAGAPVAAILCLLRHFGLVAAIPYWSIVLVIVVAQLVSLLAAAAWLSSPHGWRLTAYVAGNLGAIGMVAYSTGWGPILSLGFVFGAAATFELAGSRATKKVLFWTALYMALGQLAIRTGIAPTLIPEPRVDGLAALCFAGVLLIIALMGRSTSDRELVEEDLRHVARRFEALVKHASDIIIVVGEEGRVDYASPAFERILGRTHEEFGERPAAELIHPDDLAALPAALVDWDGGAGRRIELRLQHANGAWLWFESTVTNRRADPDVRGVVANLHDITESKLASEALRELNERFRSAFENAPIGMVMRRPDGFVIRGQSRLRPNPRMPSRATSGGRDIDSFTHPDDRELEPSVESEHRLGRDRHLPHRKALLPRRRSRRLGVGAACRASATTTGSRSTSSARSRTSPRAGPCGSGWPTPPSTTRSPSLPNRELFMDRLEVSLRLSARDGHRAWP